jgi:hypothetical protein
MVRQARERNNWKLGRTQKAVYKQLQFDLETTSVNGRSQSLHVEAQWITLIIHTTMEHHQKLCRRRFWRFHNWVTTSRSSREMGRVKPNTVAELMDIANRFVGGEEAYHNKRTRSPEDDRGNRYRYQRWRSRNYDNYGSYSQVAIGYKENNYQGDDRRNTGYRNNSREDSSNNRQFQPRGSREYN